MGICLIVFTLLSLGSLSSAQFTVRPRNFIAIRDTEIQFTCESAVTLNGLNIIWERSDGVDNFVRIAYDETVETGFDRYSVDFEGRTPTQTSKSVLTLTGVLPEDAGTFHCRLVTGSAYAQLVVFDSGPQVETNTTMDEVIEGEFIGLSCFVGYRSAISWAPTITWQERTIGDLSVIDQSSPNEARSVYASVTERDHTGRLFECGAEFGTIPEENIPTGIRDDHDTDPPVYTFSSGSLGLTVVFPTENLQLMDPKEVYNPGERLIISASSRPGPSYSWQNLLNNTTVDGNILVVTEEMEGFQNWAYVAYNMIRGEIYEIRNSHGFIVENPTTTTTTVTPPSTPGTGAPEWPRNVAAVWDTEIQFTCESEVTSIQLNILWLRSDGFENFERIALDNIIENGFDRYSVVYEGRTSSATSRSVLTLTGVLPEDGGTFLCRIVTGEGYAQLIVLASDPQVEANTTMDEVIEREFIGLSCFVGYTSAISWAPKITWRERTIGALPVIDQSRPNEARYIYASATDRDHTGQHFECGAEFGSIPEENIPESIRDNHDMVPPIYTFVSITVNLTVLFPVENLELPNQKEVYIPGESLAITANGRPGPSFSWRNLMDNSIVDGNILFVTEEMEGIQNWAYAAQNTIRGQKYLIVDSHSFIVEGIPEKHSSYKKKSKLP